MNRKKFINEKELLKGMTPYTAHAELIVTELFYTEVSLESDYKCFDEPIEFNNIFDAVTDNITDASKLESFSNSLINLREKVSQK